MRYMVKQNQIITKYNIHFWMWWKLYIRWIHFVWPEHSPTIMLSDKIFMQTKTSSVFNEGPIFICEIPTQSTFTKLSALCHESIISILIIQMFCLTIKRFRFCCTTIAWTWNVRLSTLLQFIQEDISFRILLLKSSWLTEVSPWNLFEKYVQHVILGFISRVKKVGFRRYGLLRGEPIDWGIQSHKEGWNAKPWSSF